MSQDKTKEIIILSECEGYKYKVGLEIYKTYTKDSYFNNKDIDENDPRTIHPTTDKDINGKNYKIHFFDIQDRYWPATSNICRHCDGAIFAMDLDQDKKPEGEKEIIEESSESKKEEETDNRVEFVNEWLSNLDDLDKEDMSKIIVGVSKSSNDSIIDSKWKKLTELADEKKIDYHRVNIIGKNAANEINEVFNILVRKITGDTGGPTQRNKVDEEVEEYLDKYKLF